MSDLIDQLEKAGETAPSAFGFGAASRPHDFQAELVLIGRVDSDGVAKNSRLLEIQVDAFLVSLDSWNKRTLRSVAGSLADRLWGVSSKEMDRDRADQLKERGCDFFAFDAGSTAAGVLNDDELGKLITVGPDLNEDMARSIQDLPIDGVLFSPEQNLAPLTVEKLMEVQSVRGLVEKPFAMAAPAELGSAELEALRDIGVMGLVVDLTSPHAIEEMREAVAKLPRRRPRRQAFRALVPRMATESTPPGEGDEEEDMKL